MTSLLARAVERHVLLNMAGTKPHDLDRTVDLSLLGLGEQTVGFLLTISAGHDLMHTGEIAAGKGLLGLKGYPM